MPNTWLSARSIERVILLVGAMASCSSAYAVKSDRERPIQASADHEIASLGDAGKVTLTGHVRIDQGSLSIQGNQATAYENQNNQWDHAIVNGTPARFHQILDNGSLVHGAAASIEYLVAENTVILTGDATVVQEGRGSFHGGKLTYDTDSGRIVGESSQGERVHMTFQPKSVTRKPVPKPTLPAMATSSPNLINEK